MIKSELSTLKFELLFCQKGFEIDGLHPSMYIQHSQVIERQHSPIYPCKTSDRRNYVRGLTPNIKGALLGIDFLSEEAW